MIHSPSSQKILILPSAKLVPLELQIEFGAIPSGMIPLASQPAVRYIAEPYVRRGYNVIVAVHEQAHQVERYIANHPELLAKAVEVGKTNSLGETINRTLEHLEEPPAELVINFGDTYVGDEPDEGNIIFYKSQLDAFRWTVFQSDSQKQLVQILDKNQDKLNSDMVSVFVGVFVIKNVSLFQEKLKIAVENQSADIILDPFYTAIMAYFNSLSEPEKSFQEVKDWRDFGHLDTYHATKKLFCINQRYFNQIQVDPRRGIVRKTSQDVQKFIHEISWYLRLPKSIKYMAPRVFDYSLEPSDPFVVMEFYGYPALNDMYLFGDCDAGIWNQVFIAIQNLMEEMGQYHLKPEGSDTLKGAMQDIYYEKTLKRLAPILADERFIPFCDDVIQINHVSCVGLRQVLNTLPEVIKAIDLYESPYFTIIHGDLCLSNILYDRANRIIRLIDPRGTFGVFDIYGDPRYDLAKLAHSIDGDYDFYCNGLFDSGWEAGTFIINPHLDKRHERVKEIFRTHLLNDRNPNYLQVKLIESLLFLSMVPLHADRHASQLAFLARGLELYTNVLQLSLQRI